MELVHPHPHPGVRMGGVGEERGDGQSWLILTLTQEWGGEGEGGDKWGSVELTHPYSGVRMGGVGRGGEMGGVGSPSLSPSLRSTTST